MPSTTSRFFGASQSSTESGPSQVPPTLEPSPKRQKVLPSQSPSAEPSNLDSDDEDLPELDSLLPRAALPVKISERMFARFGDSAGALVSQPANPDDRTVEPRLPANLRLARFLSFTRANPTSDSTGAIEPAPQGSSASCDRQSVFRKKLACKSASVVKWEQAKSVWEPGFEDLDYDPPGTGPIEMTEEATSSDAESQDGEHSQRSKKNAGKNKKGRQSQNKRTQLEQQWSEFKKQHPHLVLLMEVGYKIRLFGPDAVLASKVLSIGHIAIPGHETAFFPKTNLRTHLSRLVMAGHKVGLVSQSETGSLRKGSGAKKALFKRHLSEVYSLATWTEDDVNPESCPSRGGNNSCEAHQTWIISFYEARVPVQGTHSHSDKVEMNMVALCPQNGDIVWDAWTDDSMRSKLETLMLYFKPVEVLLPLNGLSARSERLINWICINEVTTLRVKARVECIERDFDARSSYEFVTMFCQPLKHKTQEECLSNEDTSQHEECPELGFLPHIVELPDGVLIALAGLILHMKSYKLESVFRQAGHFRPFLSQSHMVLNSNTLRNLEIFQNSTDGSERGSLLWILDRTKTPMGKRLLKQWIGKPLVDAKLLKLRADAIHEVASSQSHHMILKMKRMLVNRLPDLEKCLVRIQYGKCTEKELLKFLDAMTQLGTTFVPPSMGRTHFTSNLLNEAFMGFFAIKEQVLQYRSELNASAINTGEFDNMFINTDEKYPQITELKDCISCVEAELADHLQACRVLLQNPKLQYITIGTDEMLMEVRIQYLARVPENWTKISSTRAVHRFRSPEAQRLWEERDKYRELLSQTTRACFLGFLRSMEEDYESFRGAINKLSLIDCLMSLAASGIEHNYCRPNVVDHPVVDVRRGRHPVVEQLTDDPLIDNDVRLSQGDLSTMILTGNNMGGKSVTSKMIACIVLMAQIGCYVPAESATIGIFDACYTRMGMSEELSRGRSAFMVEMSETSKILKLASSRSLVIIDELGYGTSTYDGLAIASAVLYDLVTRIGCCTVFITHYPQLNELALKYPKSVQSFHMKFLETTRLDGTPEITFLYKLIPGLATKSHGIHVARLAGLTESILRNAYLMSKSLEDKIELRRRVQRKNRIQRLLKGLSNQTHDSSVEHLSLAQLILDTQSSR